MASITINGIKDEPCDKKQPSPHNGHNGNGCQNGEVDMKKIAQKIDLEFDKLSAQETLPVSLQTLEKFREINKEIVKEIIDEFREEFMSENFKFKSEMLKEFLLLKVSEL